MITILSLPTNLTTSPSPRERGFPLQLVAEGKYGYKWAKWITGIEVTDDENYEGSWKRRGYNNDADVDSPKFQ
ncbi:MAG: oxidoreductase molybdopterin binding protein [Methanohalophilus sp.]|nr:MAG: oxidoreductase molybdopterin binding protein [Methanohalophilus sp. 2-GBenrich]RSD33437.1 MAG: oxidoreductase molybdopterin binding protein [Methanohalophilus sp.]RXG34578.1 oxidoreductase molybdopterin binding protein [Methanohalophilus sp. WG1-DM]